MAGRGQDAQWRAQATDPTTGKDVKTYDVSYTAQPASSIILGLMRIDALDDEQIRTLVGSALDSGVNVLDHADIYGDDRHGCERRFGDAVKLTPDERERVVIQSKVGIRDGYFDFSASTSCERSTSRSPPSARTTSTCCSCTDRTPWSSRKRSPPRSMRCSPRGRCGTSASPTTLLVRSSS